MKVKFKKLSESAVIPKYSKKGDAGVDLTANTVRIDGDIITFSTQVAVEIPLGYVGLLFPRSSIRDSGLQLCNSVGIIDSSYRGSIDASFRIMESNAKNPYKVGDRVAQLVIMPYPNIELEEVEELSETDRGIGGFGSSGN